MGKAFFGLHLYLRVDMSLGFHTLCLSPACLHSDPVLKPGPSKLACTSCDFPFPSNSRPSYYRSAGDPGRIGGIRSSGGSDICLWLCLRYALGFLVCGLWAAVCRAESFKILHLFSN